MTIRRSGNEGLNEPAFSISDVLQTRSVRTPYEIAEALARLKISVLAEGLSDGEKSSTRARMWKLLLDVREVSAQEYLELVKLGPSSAHDKIRNDTFRTLATDASFQKRVKEAMLSRLLDAFVWRSLKETQSLEFSYVQGMNVLAGPFLYIMPAQLEAFYAFSKFIEVNCPLYVQPTMQGVHHGMKLLDSCLAILDRELSDHLQSKGLIAEVYAFPSILTFSAGTPPLKEVLRLWDFLLAYGVHLNILCVIAQLYLMRSELLASTSPIKLLRTFPPLDACTTIGLCCQFVKDIPKELYDKLARHPWDVGLKL